MARLWRAWSPGWRLLAPSWRVLGAGLAGYASVRCWRVSITLTPETLIVRNVFRTRRLPLTQVLMATPYVDGVAIRMSGGQVICAVAVQRSQLADMAGRRTRADDIARAITDAAAARTGVTVAAPARLVPTSGGQLAVRAGAGVVLLLVAIMEARLPGRFAGLIAGLFGPLGVGLILIPALVWFTGWRLDRKRRPRR